MFDRFPSRPEFRASSPHERGRRKRSGAGRCIRALLIGLLACAGSGVSTRAEPPPRAAQASAAADQHEASSVSYEVERTFLRAAGSDVAMHLPRGRPAPLPSVLVFHSAMGRTESVVDWCDRLAARGFAAVSLDFYAGETATSPEQARTLRDAANAQSARLQELVERVWSAMQQDPRLLSERRFLLGWSFGGAWATYSAGFLPGAAGVVALYGQAFSSDANLYETIDAPVLLVGGQADTAPAATTLRAIVEQLHARGKPASLFMVPAGHGFAERRHPGWDEGAAATAWAESVRFLVSSGLGRTRSRGRPGRVPAGEARRP